MHAPLSLACLPPFLSLFLYKLYCVVLLQCRPRQPNRAAPAWFSKEAPLAPHPRGVIPASRSSWEARPPLSQEPSPAPLSRAPISGSRQGAAPGVLGHSGPAPPSVSDGQSSLKQGEDHTVTSGMASALDNPRWQLRVTEAAVKTERSRTQAALTAVRTAEGTAETALTALRTAESDVIQLRLQLSVALADAATARTEEQGHQQQELRGMQQRLGVAHTAMAEHEGEKRGMQQRLGVAHTAMAELAVEKQSMLQKLGDMEQRLLDAQAAIREHAGEKQRALLLNKRDLEQHKGLLEAQNAALALEISATAQVDADAIAGMEAAMLVSEGEARALQQRLEGEKRELQQQLGSAGQKIAASDAANTGLLLQLRAAENAATASDAANTGLQLQLRAAENAATASDEANTMLQLQLRAAGNAAATSNAVNTGLQLHLRAAGNAAATSNATNTRLQLQLRAAENAAAASAAVNQGLQLQLRAAEGVATASAAGSQGLQMRLRAAEGVAARNAALAAEARGRLQQHIKATEQAASAAEHSADAAKRAAALAKDAVLQRTALDQGIIPGPRNDELAAAEVGSRALQGQLDAAVVTRVVFARKVTFLEEANRGLRLRAEAAEGALAANVEASQNNHQLQQQQPVGAADNRCHKRPRQDGNEGASGAWQQQQQQAALVDVVDNATAAARGAFQLGLADCMAELDRERVERGKAELELGRERLERGRLGEELGRVRVERGRAEAEENKIEEKLCREKARRREAEVDLGRFRAQLDIVKAEPHPMVKVEAARV